MSVSMSDTHASVSTSGLSPTTSAPEVNAARPEPAPNGQTATSFSFLSRHSQGGPVFADQQPLGTHLHSVDNEAQHYSVPASRGFIDSAKHWVGHWFAGHRPPHHPGCGHAPPRPNPGCGHPPPRPDPCMGKPYPAPPCRPHQQYSLKNNEELAQQLLNNFDAFRDRKNPGYVSVDSIHAMAKKGWSPNPVTNANIRLANELLRRPELMSALDRHTSTGALDGLIDRQNVSSVIRGENDFKYKSDKELAGEMLEHFDDLKSNPHAQELSFNDLRRWAAQRPNGHASRSHLIQLAQEVLKRSDMLAKMDNIAGRDNDGRISRHALHYLSR
ncbi:type III secretion effector protein [Pseudomonas sp. SB113]|uniref:type III secretion effector protein n=1 Tax=Pseudomonas sp. SB113 TaxID=3154123 RepID=UPI00345D48E9